MNQRVKKRFALEMYSILVIEISCICAVGSILILIPF